jgi:spermidine synthase
MFHRTLSLLIAVAALALGCQARAEPKVLFEKQSPYSLIIVSDDEQGLRTLYFGRNGVRQSVYKPTDPDHIELPYAKVMVAGLAFHPRPQRLLMIGLGGGTIPNFLHKHFPHLTIDVVEIDPLVLEVAKKFFDFREDEKMKAHIADGRKFIEKTRETYDIILLDAFGSKNIPYHLATREFLRAVRRALAPDGVAVGNVWSSDWNPLYHSMVRTYQDVFAELCVIEVGGAGNRILVALPKRNPIKPQEIAQRAAALSREKQFRFDLGELVRRGFQQPAQSAALGRVLTDADKPPEAE